MPARQLASIEAKQSRETKQSRDRKGAGSSADAIVNPFESEYIV
jgi:hypothetical protein